MFQFTVGRLAVASLAVIAPALQHLSDCGLSTSQSDVPTVEIQGPDTVTKGEAATYRIVAQGLGKGQPCPDVVNFAFIDEYRADPVKVSIKDPTPAQLADGSCVVTAEASHAFSRGTDAGASAEVDVELNANLVLRAQNTKIVKVYNPGTAPASPSGPAAGDTVITSPSPAPGGGTTTAPTTRLSFNTVTKYPSAGHVAGVAVGDFAAGSGLAVASAVDRATGTDDQVDIAPVATNGTLGSPTTVGLGRDGAVGGIASGDFDRDGHTDLVVLDDNRAIVLMNQGDGTFQQNPAGGYPTGFAGGAGGAPDDGVVSPNVVAVRDVNNDGYPDIVVGGSNTTGGTVGAAAVLLNIGVHANGFGSPEGVATGGQGIYGLAIADLNHDGKVDLATADPMADTVSALRNLTADGADPVQFDTAQQLSHVDGRIPYGIVASDLDGDGEPDLAVTNHGLGSVSILRNATAPGSTAFSFNETVLPADTNPGGRVGPIGIASGDFDGDGRRDLVTANFDAANLSVYLGDGTSFGSPLHVATGPGAQAVTAADLNGDGKPDLIAGDYGTDQPSESPGEVAVAINTSGSPVTSAGARAASRNAVAGDARSAKRRKAVTLKATGGASLTISDYGQESYAADGSGIAHGATMSGRLGGRLSKKDARRAPKGLATILSADFAGKVDAVRHVDPQADNPIIATGVLAGRARSNHRLQACIRVSPGPNGTQRATLLWASGSLSRLRLTTDVQPLSIDHTPRPGQATITVARGAARKLPAACKGLLGKVAASGKKPGAKKGKK